MGGNDRGRKPFRKDFRPQESVERWFGPGPTETRPSGRNGGFRQRRQGRQKLRPGDAVGGQVGGIERVIFAVVVRTEWGRSRIRIHRSASSISTSPAMASTAAARGRRTERAAASAAASSASRSQSTQSRANVRSKAEGSGKPWGMNASSKPQRSAAAKGSAADERGLAQGAGDEPSRVGAGVGHRILPDMIVYLLLCSCVVLFAAGQGNQPRGQGSQVQKGASTASSAKESSPKSITPCSARATRARMCLQGPSWGVPNRLLKSGQSQ
jgi:hypothetical protein